MFSKNMKLICVEWEPIIDLGKYYRFGVRGLAYMTDPGEGVIIHERYAYVVKIFRLRK